MKSARFVEVSRAGPEAVVMVVVTVTAGLLFAAAPRPLGMLPEPWLSAAIVYFWTHRRPGVMPIWAVFLIGLFQDLLTGSPMGLWALSLLAISMIGRLTRSQAYGEALPRRIAYFAGAVLVMVLASWMALSLVGLGARAPLASIALHGLVTVLAYPLVEAALGFLAARVGLRRGAIG